MKLRRHAYDRVDKADIISLRSFLFPSTGNDERVMSMSISIGFGTHIEGDIIVLRCYSIFVWLGVEIESSILDRQVFPFHRPVRRDCFVNEAFVLNHVGHWCAMGEYRKLEAVFVREMMTKDVLTVHSNVFVNGMKLCRRKCLLTYERDEICRKDIYN